MQPLVAWGLSFEMKTLKLVGAARSSALMLLAGGAAIVAAPVAAQAVAPPSAASMAAQPAPAAPGAVPQVTEVQPAPVPQTLPPPIWDMGSVAALLQYIQQVGREGLNPADYDPAGLQAAMASGNPFAVSAAATKRFNELSSDLALGHVQKVGRLQWFVEDKDLSDEKQDALLREALARRDIAGALNGLLPTHPQYAALKAALAATPAAETAKRDRIRLNLDRWRWLPRDLGSKYIIVNVPGFHATLVENGVNRWKQRAIAGSVKTQTPSLSAMATGVVLNPWWEVPPSITREVAGKAGYVAVKGKDGKVQRWRQPPGPSNALGQMKFVMYNPHNIYLHDTNARSRFSSRMRALSHGCIRTQNIHDLAAELGADDGGEWTREKIDAQLATGKTKQADFVKPLPVYIVYFTVAGLNDGRIVDYSDLYGRDAKAMAALNTKDGGASLGKPKTQVASK